MKKSGDAFQKTEHPLHCKGQVPFHKLALQIHTRRVMQVLDVLMDTYIHAGNRPL